MALKAKIAFLQIVGGHSKCNSPHSLTQKSNRAMSFNNERQVLCLGLGVSEVAQFTAYTGSSWPSSYQTVSELSMVWQSVREPKMMNQEIKKCQVLTFPGKPALSSPCWSKSPHCIQYRALKCPSARVLRLWAKGFCEHHCSSW